MRWLEQYLENTDIPDLDDPILDWWKVKECKWPALAKMVKQYFAAPASSGGVERVFSAAGKMHGDLQKSAKDSTLRALTFRGHKYGLRQHSKRVTAGEGKRASVLQV